MTATQKLVKGYMIQATSIEYLYAVTDAGKVFVSETIERPNTNFDVRTRRWTQIETLPEAAQYIGNYPYSRKWE